MARRPEEREQLQVARDWRVSPKRFLGWEPSWETVYEYDDAGRLVRSVTRQLEPEWDETTRLRAEGLARYEAERCPGCNLHSSILADPEANRFTFEERFCEVCKGQDVMGRVIARNDEKASKSLRDAPPIVPRPGDGRHVYLRPLLPVEVEEQKAKRRERR
ncbi:MAG TPA: hypothetical protein VFJ19_07290 [Nocardioidaceae bacterium]|nr:hypothetical protein [Nocardioidaceae bacterium]